MGKKLSCIVLIECILLLALGFSVLFYTWWTNQHNDLKNRFEYDNSQILLNGTVQEIQYNFMEDRDVRKLYITINERTYDLRRIYRSIDYFNNEHVPTICEDLYYSLDVGDYLVIYESGNTTINNVSFKETSWKSNIDDRLFGFNLFFILCTMGSVALLKTLLIRGILWMRDIPYYKEKYEEYKEINEQRYKENKKIKKENKDLQKQLELLTSGNKMTLVSSISPMVKYCHECGSKVKGNHCSYCGAEV